MITFFYKGERERDSEFMLRFGCIAVLWTAMPIRAFFMSIVFFHKKRGKIKRFWCLLEVAFAINTEIKFRHNGIYLRVTPCYSVVNFS